MPLKKIWDSVWLLAIERDYAKSANFFDKHVYELRGRERVPNYVDIVRSLIITMIYIVVNADWHCDLRPPVINTRTVKNKMPGGGPNQSLNPKERIMMRSAIATWSRPTIHWVAFEDSSSIYYLVEFIVWAALFLNASDLSTHMNIGIPNSTGLA